MSYTITKIAGLLPGMSTSTLSDSASIASALNGPITNVSIDLSSSSSDYKFMYKST